MRGMKPHLIASFAFATILRAAHPAAAGDISVLSTPELERLVKAGGARVAAAFGKHKSVIVQGEITDPGERLMVLVGRVVPNRQAQFNGLFYYDGSGFEGLGTHANPSCLMVQNPKGRILNGRYMDGPPFSKEDLFYLGEGRATNGFGAPVSCSIYGRFDELPANIRAAVKKASEDVQPLKAELKRKLEAKWMAAEAEREAAEATQLKRVERDRTEHKQGQVKEATEKETQRGKEAGKKDTERVNRQTEFLNLKRNLEGVRTSLAEADSRCKSARARTMEATRSQSMGMGTTDEEINRVFAEETSACNERGRLSVKKVALETDIRRMGGGAADESTAMAATPRPATEIHPTSVGSSMPPRPIATRSPTEEALDRGDWATAYAAYAPRAEAGDSDAQVRLGVMYYDALGRKQDFELAESWFRKAAQRGNAEAKYRLALLFSEGRKGAPWDLEAARQFLAESAPIYPESAYKLGRFYWDGIGVPEDRIKAREWIEKAAAKGDSSAIDWMRSQK